MANGGHYVKEGRVFVQDKDGTFLELVPMPDGNFNTKPAKKEDVRGADFIEGPFDPQRAAFAGQKLPGETPPAPAPPGPPMPPGYTLTAEEEQEVGASAEAAQQQAEQRLADEPMNDPPAADDEFDTALYDRVLGGEYKKSSALPLSVAVEGIEKLGMDPEAVLFYVNPEGTVLPYVSEESYLKYFPDDDPSDLQLGASAAQAEMETLTEEVEEEAPAEEEVAAEEEEAAEALDEVVEEEASDNTELEAETNAPELEGMGGRERVAYVLKNRSQFPEFNRALRSAAEQFYSDRRFRRTAVATAALGGMPEALAMMERRGEPARRERAELMAERDRLITARDKAREFNAELQKGETELAAQLFGDLLSTSAEVRGQESRLEQGRLEASAGMQAELRLADLKQQGDEVKARQKDFEDNYGASSGQPSYDGDALLKGRAAVIKMLKDKNVANITSLQAREQGLLRAELTAISGAGFDAEGLQQYYGDLSAYMGTDTAVDQIASMGRNEVKAAIDEAGDAEVKAAIRRGNPSLSPVDVAQLASGIERGKTNLDDEDKREALFRLGEAESQYEQSYNEAIRRAGVGKAATQGEKAREEVIGMTGPIVGADGRIDTDANLLQISQVYADVLSGPGGMLDTKQYDTKIADVDKSLSQTKMTPMERQIESLKKTDEGARAIRGMMGLGYTEREAVEALITDVGKRSFKKDTRDLKGALRRERRGKLREGDLDVLMAEDETPEPQEAPEAPPAVEESPTEEVTGAAPPAPQTPSAPPMPPQTSASPGIFEGADYTTRRQQKQKDAVMDLLRKQGIA